MKTPTTLIIMDGFGLSERRDGNAVYAARTPSLDALLASCPHTRLSASGEDVGLPSGTMGNSEVGHTNIGAGRIVYQSLLRISNAIKDSSFYENAAFVDAICAARDSGHSLHLFGLLSDAGVHSHTDHLWAYLELAKRLNMERVYIHCFMDGRDTPPTSGAGYMERLTEKCRELGVGRVATVTGRNWAMDRDKRWNRVELGYNAIVMGQGVRADDPVAAIRAAYAAGETDEFIKPIVIDPEGTVSAGDSVIFFNFRPDRARELTRAFVDPDFSAFERKHGFFKLRFVCATQYEAGLPNVTVAYPPEALKNTFGEFLSRIGLTQLRIAETEKYAHVTFFFNGGEEKEFPGESRVLIPSPREYATYDLIPEMSAYKVADAVCQRIASGEFDVIVCNLANCDMVGHTGNFGAAVRAVEVVDECVGKIVEATAALGGVSLICADHGNAETMLEPDGVSPHTAHTLNPVPFIIAGANVKLREGRLCDIAPTLLELIGMNKPDEMTGESLIVN